MAVFFWLCEFKDKNIGCRRSIMSGNRVSQRCVGVTRRGEACRGRAMKESDYCVAHRWQTPPPTPSADARKRRSGEGVESEEVDTGQSMVLFQTQPVRS